ncbi:MAG TPA: hypothetical protein VNJ08_08460 [Bacteriovoracaceae bacterium]|nr:hypothetical protein [Bacteriovoracaceae bacterium]
MFVFLVLCSITFMIFTLVRNALVGVQLNSSDTYQGDIELIIPITTRSEFYLEPWMKSLHSFRTLQGNNLRIHILIDGHHPAMTAWQELHQKLPFVELHSFPLRPEGEAAIPWMIRQISPQIRGRIVIIGDAELVPTESAFLSLAHHVAKANKPFFVLPQTARLTHMGESVAVLNPTLALASVFGFKKYRRNLSHPLMSIAQGWMGMSLKLFHELDWGKMALPSWKQSIAEQWDRSQQSYTVAFGEKHLLRYYPDEVRVQIQQMRTYWEELWSNGDRAGLWLFAVAIFLWFFPIASFWFFPLWSIATLILLGLYRFFSKIVFQERWPSVFLHPFGCMVWIVTFFWWASGALRERYGARGPLRS